MKLKGTLKEWNDEKGYGFITPSTGGLDVFAHISAFQNRSRRPNPGEVVIYHPEKSESGKHRAVSVSYCSEKMRTWAPQKIGLGLWIALPASFAFLIAIWILYSMDRILWELAALYFVASIIAFILYWDDKYAARKGYWRTTEKSFIQDKVSDTFLVLRDNQLRRSYLDFNARLRLRSPAESHP
jgi:cold shock CspA family protein